MGLCAGLAIGIASLPAQAAPVPVSIEITNSNYNATLNDPSHPIGVNYSYSEIHNASTALGIFNGNTYYEGGTTLLSPINGTLSGDLETVGTTITLSNILGTLSSTYLANNSEESITITGGSLSSDTTNNKIASGFLNYTLSGALSATGRFDFQSVKYLTNLPAGTWSPNYLSTSSLYLWGDNWVVNGDNRPTDGSALGLDLGGNITTLPAPVPLPAAVLLFGSGLLGLAGAMRKKFNLA